MTSARVSIQNAGVHVCMVCKESLNVCHSITIVLCNVLLFL